MSANVDRPLVSASVPRSRPPDGPYLVAGLGIAGLAAAEALADRYGPAAVRAWSPSVAPPFRDRVAALGERGVELRIEPCADRLLEGRRCVIKSPGIPDDAGLLLAARAAGIETIDEAELGWRLDARPLVGVTGTNGKSTVCALIAASLEAAGAVVASGGNREGGPALSALAGVDADVVVGELSSFQLRHAPTLLPEVAVLTNCTHDSWHRHGGRDGYERDKSRIALSRDGEAAAPHAVLPADDPLGGRLAARVAAAGGTVVGFGFAASADYRIVACDGDLDRATIEIATPLGMATLGPRLPGSHNALNVAAALAAAVVCGVALDVAVAAIDDAPPVPGRFERIGDPSGGFDLFVDYAHNPDGLRRTLATARAVVERRGAGRVIVVASALPVFDDAQYEAMGRALVAADRVIATTERLSADAQIEEPPAFVSALRASVPDMTFEVDRRTAVERAVGEASAGDVVLVLGRGRRRTPIHVPGSDAPLRIDDRESARAALAGELG